MTKIFISLSIVVLVFGAYFFITLRPDAGEQNTTSDISLPVALNTPMKAIIKTNQGVIELELFGDDAPKTVENFATLAEKGFYNGTRFHRVISGFMIQGGDPQSSDLSKKEQWGTGGPGYVFDDEIHANNHNLIGTIAMANAGPGTNGSQFFINVADNNFLDPKHTVFGKVISGMEVVQVIEKTQTEGPDRPVSDMLIESVTILR